MTVSNIYYETLKHLELGARRIIHQGGQYSGKTVNILGALATVCNNRENIVVTVTSLSFPHLKGGAMRDFEYYVHPHFKNAITKYNKTDHTYYFKSGSIIEFKVYETAMAAHGAKRDILFVNEANSFSHAIWFQLDSRSGQSIIDYNPSIRFWAHEDLIGQEGNITLYSDHRHNPFIDEKKHQEIENIKDPQLWKVYARGITGNVTGVIFPNWEMIDDGDFPKDEDFVWGIDFGYTNDPTCIIKLVKIANTLFVKEIAYETGLPPQSIRQILVGNGYNQSMPLYCEHDPDMIRILRSKFGIKAIFARKGQGSINAGIEHLNQYDKVFYTNTSKNLHRERGLYIWAKDKDTGKSLNIPVDANNHSFDATRYADYSHYLRNGS